MRTAAAPAYGYGTAYQTSRSNPLRFRKNDLPRRDQPRSVRFARLEPTLLRLPAVSGQGRTSWSVNDLKEKVDVSIFGIHASCCRLQLHYHWGCGFEKWVLAVELPGVSRYSLHVLEACGAGLASFVERLKARCTAAGRKIDRVIRMHEAGRDGFWLARFLARRCIEVHVVQPSSLPVDRRARRAKTDIIDVEMLLRTLMAWLRGERRVCSMAPIPSEADEEARRAYREREDLTGERRSIVNKIDGILATLGIKG